MFSINGGLLFFEQSVSWAITGRTAPFLNKRPFNHNGEGQGQNSSTFCFKSFTNSVTGGSFIMEAWCAPLIVTISAWAEIARHAEATWYRYKSAPTCAL
jgi:hypothetical protein